MKKRVPAIVACILLLLSSANLRAQGEFGGHPLGQDWHILTSPAVRVIFPVGMDSSARRVASIINYIDTTNRRSVGPLKKRVDIVLQNQTVNPNGYVALAPFRSEFFSTPPQSSLVTGSTNWLDLLAIHEYRHVLQSVNSRRGIVKFMYWLQGEAIWQAMNAIVTPDWYSEGDAVITETALTESGRGRASFFSLQQRALAKADLNYRYAKHRNGSYVSMLPNQYPLGYMMLNYLRNKKGNDVTAEILRNATRFVPPFYSFSRAMKRETGFTTPKLYRAAWQDFKVKAAEELSETELIPTLALTANDPRRVTRYDYPLPLDDGTLIARKRSYAVTDRIVRLDGDKETILTTIGFNQDEWLAEGNGLLTWAESTKNPRRGYQDYSDIVTYDLKSQQKNRLTKFTRYFSPSVSPDGQRVAVIHITPTQQNEILVLDAKSGIVIKKIANPENYFLSRTAWAEDGNFIVSFAKVESRLSLIKWAIDEAATTQLTPWSAHTMDSPFVKDGKVYFNAGYSGIDNIYSTDLGGSQEIYQVTSVPVGAFEPSVGGGYVYFTQFNAQGHYVSRQKLADVAGRAAIEIEKPVDMARYQSTAVASEGGEILSKVQPTDFPVRKYSGLFQGIKFYSWTVTPSVAVPAIDLGMVNLLNDVQISLGGGINRNENNASFYNASLRIARFYPAIALNASNSQRNSDYLPLGSQPARLKFNETKIGGTISIPESWQKGNFLTTFTPYTGLDYYLLSGLVTETGLLPHRNFAAYTIGGLLSSVRRRAYQNVGPRLGFALLVRSTQTLGSATPNDKQFSRLSLYLPGVGRNHAVEIKLGYQSEPLANLYQFADEYEYPRGYATPINDKFYSLSANYGLPLLYPDFGLLGITYFKRVRANLFYDYGVGEITRLARKTKYNSVGAEIIFDNTYLNLLPLSLGVRTTYLLQNDPASNRKVNVGIFLSTNF